jgi:hypothetical protein
MGMNWELAHDSDIPRALRTIRWRDFPMPRYAPAIEPGPADRPTWGKVLGLVIALGVSAGAWTAVAIALSHLLK